MPCGAEASWGHLGTGERELDGSRSRPCMLHANYGTSWSITGRVGRKKRGGKQRVSVVSSANRTAKRRQTSKKWSDWAAKEIQERGAYPMKKKLQKNRAKGKGKITRIKARKRINWHMRGTGLSLLAFITLGRKKEKLKRLVHFGKKKKVYVAGPKVKNPAITIEKGRDVDRPNNKKSQRRGEGGCVYYRG